MGREESQKDTVMHMQRLAVPELQKQVLWLLGVLMGVALKEAITNSHAVFLNRDEPWGCLIGLRLIPFLCVSLCLYIGTIQHFSAAFETSPSASELRRRRIGWDLIFGLIHFVFVCFCGLSIALLDRRWPAFPGMLLAILLCDAIWYATAAIDTRRAIRIRVSVNVVTALTAMLAFGTTAFAFMCIENGWRVELTQTQGAVCEATAYVPTLIASGVALGRLIYGRGVEEWLAEALPRTEVRAG
jgi:hypothetical protein